MSSLRDDHQGGAGESRPAARGDRGARWRRCDWSSPPPARRAASAALLHRQRLIVPLTQAAGSSNTRRPASTPRGRALAAPPCATRTRGGNTHPGRPTSRTARGSGAGRGCSIASICPMAPPVEWPTKCAASMPSASISLMMSPAICSTEYCDARVGAPAGAPVIVDDRPGSRARSPRPGVPRTIPARRGRGPAAAAHPDRLFVVDLGVADRDVRHGGALPGVVHPHRALDRHHVGRPLERRRRGIPRLSGAGRSPRRSSRARAG